MAHTRKLIALFTVVSFIAAWLQPPLAALAQDKEDQAFIAVLDLDVASGIPDEARISLSDLLREQLWKTGRFRVVDRNNMERVLKEQGFQLADCTSTECAVQVGRLLGVAKMVTGNVTRLGRTYVLTAQVTNVETGEIEKMASDRCPGCEVDELLGSIDVVATTLAGVGAVRRERPAPPKPKEPEPGKLSLASSPAQAKIYLNGKEMGITPNLITGLKAGTYEVRLRMDGYLEYVERVSVRAGETEAIEADLVAVAPSAPKEEPLPEVAPAPRKKGKAGAIIATILVIGLAGGGGFLAYSLLSDDEGGEDSNGGGVTITISGPLP